MQKKNDFTYHYLSFRRNIKSEHAPTTLDNYTGNLQVAEISKLNQ
jgi:hypothetical protein